MVLQLFKGLSEEYKPFRTSVRHLNPLPSFDTLRSMLELKEQGNTANVVAESLAEAHVSHSSSVVHNQIGENVPNSTYYHGANTRSGGRKNNKNKGGGGKNKSVAGNGGWNNQQ
ncbi:uncharacterized protein LOC110737528 [Chenopodium quinoa]|nr:uncharacterized protein LOC110737528 [Chenopodium quinoa]